MNKLLIKNATIINEGKRSSKDIYIEGEYIKEIKSNIEIDDNIETINVSKALSLYALALPAYILVKVLEPSFFARGNTKTPMKIFVKVKSQWSKEDKIIAGA